MSTIIAIDPGVNGYLATSFSKDEIYVQKLGPLLERNWRVLRELNPTVYLEKVQPRPSQSLRGVVTSCVNYGVLKAIMVLVNFRHIWVSPQEWQKYLGLNRRWSRPKGLTDEQYSTWKYQKRKKWHKAEAKKLYPALKVTLANADALLIAEYGRRLNG